MTTKLPITIYIKNCFEASRKCWSVVRCERVYSVFARYVHFLANVPRAVLFTVSNTYMWKSYTGIVAFIAADLRLSQFRPVLLHTKLIASPWRKVTQNKLHLSSPLQTLSTTRKALKQNVCFWWEKTSCSAEPLELQKTVQKHSINQL